MLDARRLHLRLHCRQLIRVVGGGSESHRIGVDIGFETLSRNVGQNPLLT